MDTTIELIEGTLRDPVVITSTAAVSLALLTGAVARAIEVTERQPRRRRSSSGSVGTG